MFNAWKDHFFDGRLEELVEHIHPSSKDDLLKQTMQIIESCTQKKIEAKEKILKFVPRADHVPQAGSSSSRTPK